MAKKRGASGLCFVVGVDKPVGMSSHDVVNRCRRIFGERRVGHCGTLDPLASGVMVVCVGPSTRLDAHLALDDKRYVARVVFGISTETDDSEGTVVRSGITPDELRTEAFARQKLAQMVGPMHQLPPAYSAIKVGGVKAYEAARQGKVIELKGRDIEVYEAKLLDIGVTSGVTEDDPLAAGGFADDVPRVYWDVEFHVSKGTYIRSLARDLGVSCGVPSYLGGLRRTCSGVLKASDCANLEALEADPEHAGRIDPIELLGHRFFFANESAAKLIANGGRLKPADVDLFICRRQDNLHPFIFPCSSTIAQDETPLEDGEVVCALVNNTLRALYQYNQQTGLLQSCCGFSIGVQRGCNL